MNIQDKILLGAGLTLFGSMIFIGGTLAVGIMTGLMSAIGLAIILVKLRDHYPRVWHCLCRHPILSDISLSTLLFFLVASSTATGVIAGASASLFASMGVTLMIKNVDNRANIAGPPMGNNPSANNIMT